MDARLLGRASELAVLKEALAEVLRTGNSGLVLVRGEAGIGKTTLIRAFTEWVQEGAGQTVLVGYGQAMTNSLGSDAFQAIRECLRSLVAGAERSRSSEMASRVAHAFRVNAPAWLESVPLVGSLLAAGAKTGMTLLEAPNSRQQLHSHLDQLTTLVGDLFESGPVVLALDDLHWADTATIDILMALALKVHGPFLLVLAYRPDDLRPLPGGEPHPLTRAVFRMRRYQPECREIDLARLSRLDTRSLIVSAGRGSSLSDDDLERLVEQSGGVPLYAESLAVVRMRRQDFGPVGETPSNISAVIEERLSFAAPEDQRLLEIAVVVGFSFEVHYVAELMRADVDEVYERLDRVMREHRLIVVAEAIGQHDRYALCHPILGEVLRRRASINAPRWRRLHQRLVDILLGQAISEELAVRAAEAAIVAEDRRAGVLALDAARREYAAGAVQKACELAKKAAELTRGSALAFDVAELLARTLAAEANHTAAAEVCARALSEVDPETVSDERVWTLTLQQMRSLRMAHQWDAVQSGLSDLEASIPADQTQLRAELLMLMAESALCGPEQATERCIELSNQVAAMSQDPALISRAFGHIGLAHLAAHAPGVAQDWLDRAVTTARAAAHPYAVYESIFWLNKKKIACLELDDAWALLQELARIAEPSGVASDHPYHQRDTSRVLSLRGDAEGAAEAFIKYMEFADRHDHGRALTILACQTRETEELHGRTGADRFLNGVTGSARRADVGSPLAVLLSAVRLLQRRPASWEPLAYASKALGVDPLDVRAGDDIFSFHIRDLRRFRREFGLT